MDRGLSPHLVSGLAALVAALLVASALTLPLQPYVGLSLREDRVATVVPGGPGDRAGLRSGDRLLPMPGAARAWTREGLGDAAPGRPLSLVRERAGDRRVVWLAPEPLPPGERRMHAALLAVACGFVLLGAWVWNERRDRLTRPFVLLCLTFALILTPIPVLGSLAALAHGVATTAAQLVVPALLIHFFALFPEPRAPRGRRSAGVRLGYATAGVLFIASLVALALELTSGSGGPVLAALQPVAALYFAAGTLAALGLFARSVVQAGSADARRRLAVAFAGATAGLAPLAAAIVMRNLNPSAEVPGERAAVVLTLLVPASFAWAVVVHRIFDFRVALRATAVAVSLAVAAAAAFVAGEWLGDLWLPAHSVQWGGTTLATLVLMVTLAGPIRPWGRSLAERTSRASSLQTLGGATRDAPAPRDDELLEGAARALTDTLRLDACAVAWLDAPRPRSGVLGEIERSPTLVAALTGRRGVMLADDSTLHPDDRAALESLGVHWMLPVGGERPRAALLLGRRLAGPWLDRAETVELERLADRLTITLENAVLRRAAESHGAIDRELAEAGQIQAHLLPRRAPVYPSLDCAAAALSCEPVGGDYFDFVEHTDREFTLVVGDAAGKGVPAALLLAGVRARIRGEELRERGPGQLLHALNRELVHLEQPEKFVGLLCAHVDARRGRVCLANAGITPPLVRRRGGGFEELTAGGVLLGVSAEAVYPDTSVELRAGDVAVIYTDGLSEARRGEELFGVDRVRAVLDRHAHRRASQILEALLDGVRAFADRPLDDLTVLVLKQLADPPTAVALAASELKLRLASADTSG